RGLGLCWWAEGPGGLCERASAITEAGMFLLEARDHFAVALEDEQAAGHLALAAAGERVAGDEQGVVIDQEGLVTQARFGGELRRQPLFEEETQFRGRILFAGRIEEDLDIRTAKPGIDERLGERPGGELAGEDGDLLPGGADLTNEQIGAATGGSEV